MVVANSGCYNSPHLRKSLSSSFPEVLLGIGLGKSLEFLSTCHDPYSCLPRAFPSRELPMREGVIILLDLRVGGILFCQGFLEVILQGGLGSSSVRILTVPPIYIKLKP